MDLAASLSDTIFKSSSLLGGLLSQVGSALDADATSNQNDLFSSLLSQTDAMQTTLAAQAQIAAATSTPSPTTVTAPTNTSSTVSADTPPNTSDALAQNLNDIAVTLRKIIAVLHQQNTNNSSGNTNKAPQAKTTGNSSTASSDGNGQTPSSTASSSTSPAATPIPPATTTVAKTVAAPVSTGTTAVVTGTATADAATATSDNTATPDTTQTLSDIIAELLAMTQLMIQGLHQAKIASGDTDKKTATQTAALVSASLDSSNALDAAGNANATPVLTDILASTAPVTPTDPLLQLLKTLQKDTQQFFPDTATAANTPNTAATTATQAAAAGATTAPTTLDAVLQQTIAVLQQQIENIAVPKTGLAAAAQSDAAANATVLTATKTSTAATNTAKATVTDTVQEQIFAATTAVAAQPAPAPVVATAASTIATSIVPTEGKGTSADADTGSGLSSGGNHTASAGTAATLGSGFSAEGLQAAGTYSFASTLSALRAANGGTTGLPTVVDQVILQMNRNVKNGSDQMSLQLHPSDLGKITVKLDFGTDGKVQGTVTADNPQTLSMLQKDSRSLERALQDAGLRADPGSLQFNLGGQSGNNAGQTANGQNNTGTANADGTLSASDIDDGTGLVDLGALAETYYVTPAGVNIRV